MVQTFSSIPVQLFSHLILLVNDKWNTFRSVW